MNGPKRVTITIEELAGCQISLNVDFDGEKTDEPSPVEILVGWFLQVLEEKDRLFAEKHAH